MSKFIRINKLARASEVIARRNAADTTRDKLYTKLYALVRLWRNSGNTAMETAADALVRVFQLYAVNTSAQIDAESGHQSMKSIDGNQPMKSTEINN